MNDQLGNSAAVTLNSAGGVLNGTEFGAAATGAVKGTDTIDSLTVTDGEFNIGSVSNWPISGAGLFDGSSGDVRFTGFSGSQSSFGSLELRGMTGSGAGGTPDLFFLGGNKEPRQNKSLKLALVRDAISFIVAACQTGSLFTGFKRSSPILSTTWTSERGGVGLPPRRVRLGAAE